MAPAFCVFRAIDPEESKAEFARMLAENDAGDSWMRTNARTTDLSCQPDALVAAGTDINDDYNAGSSAESSPTITMEDNDGNGVQFESANTDLYPVNAKYMKVSFEDEDLRAVNHALNTKIDQLKKNLEAKSLEHSEVLVQIQLRAKQSKMGGLAHEAALGRTKAYEDQVNVLKIEVATLESRNQQLEASTMTVTGFLDRIDQLHKESNIDKVQIERLSQDRFRLDEDLRRTDDANAKLQDKVIQSAHKISLLQLQLGSLSTVQAQSNDKVTELKLLRKSIETLSTEKSAQFQELCTARSELKESRKTNEICRKEIMAMKPQSDDEKVSELKRCIAKCITQFDIAWTRSRIFTCRHHSLRDVCDGRKTTALIHAKKPVEDMYMEWSDDDEFLELYHETRQFVIDHHRAHERDDPGRGEYAEYIEGLFNKIDRRRET